MVSRIRNGITTTGFLHTTEFGLSPSSSTSSTDDIAVDLVAALPAAESLREATGAVIETLTAKLVKALAMQVGGHRSEQEG